MRGIAGTLKRQALCSVSEAAEALEIKRTTLCGWIYRGLIKPFHRSGIRRDPVLLDRKNLREIAVIAGLRKAGVSLQHLRQAARYLRQEWAHNPYSSGEFLVLSGKGKKAMFKICGEGELINLGRQALKDYEAGQLSLFPLIHVKWRLERLKGGADA